MKFVFSVLKDSVFALFSYYLFGVSLFPFGFPFFSETNIHSTKLNFTRVKHKSSLS